MKIKDKKTKFSTFDLFEIKMKEVLKTNSKLNEIFQNISGNNEISDNISIYNIGTILSKLVRENQIKVAQEFLNEVQVLVNEKINDFTKSDKVKHF
jgi:hypothetical protein